ncbi:hypothetical protein ACH41E_02940 [Streptomyces sp. NPDC020412]|uniref:hypothetical protein n=1 Tax=Streptomyces sp. NPDC020412 TaxID=3365073 RepID=UPI00378CA72C
MHPNDPIVQRFPLVARPRPACRPLTERVHALRDLAQTAAEQDDPTRASAVYNQSALLASDLGLPALARKLCHRHADAYLHACPLPGEVAIRALEPVVNLARLHIRAGHPDVARQHLLTLYEAVSTGTAAELGGAAVPADLTATAADRREVRSWLWTVLLADGTRTLTAQGRWDEALAHLKEHRGVGKRMLDGRQVAVLAALTANDTASAAALLENTEPGELEEQAVTACLTVLNRRAVDRPANRDVRSLADVYVEFQPQPGMAVFDTRLGLTILDLIGGGDASDGRRVVNELHHRVTTQNDGCAAREGLAHPLFAALTSDGQRQSCQAVVDACALGTGKLPNELRDQLFWALRASDRTIRRYRGQEPSESSGR